MSVPPASRGTSGWRAPESVVLREAIDARNSPGGEHEDEIPRMDHVHVKSRSASKSNPTKAGCEKASRRLRTILVKASRLGVSTTEVARLPAAKKLIPQRDHGWKLAVFLLLMFGGGVIVALVCTARKGCSKLEDINLAT